MLDWIIQNKEIVKIFYGLIITLICITIVLKSNKLFRLSLHQGIRYFRNAFFFFGIAFIIRYLVGALVSYKIINLNFLIIKFLFEYFLIMAGFFLLHSLIWKKIESDQHPDNSLFNGKVAIFHIMALILALLDVVWHKYYFLFISQIILFAFISALSYLNYYENKKHKFPKFYFIAMLLTFAIWILNAVAPLFFNWNQGILVNIYLINTFVFLVFLYGVIKVTK